MLLGALLGVAGRSCGRRFSAGSLRRARQRGRRVTAAVLGPAVVAGAALVSVPAVVTATAVAAGVTAAAVAAAPHAKASGGPSVLVIDVNGESSAPETALLTAAGYTVDERSQGALSSMSQSAFQGYAAVVIGDPSGSSCSSWQPTTSALGTNWEGWVSGNVAVLGTDAGLAASLASGGNTAAKTLITDSVAYAVAQNGSPTPLTGLYLSLGCGYSAAASGTPLPVLNGVDGIGPGGGVTVNGSLSCGDSGTVNKWEATAAGTFSGFDSGSLAAGSPGWPSPGCPVQEAFDSWPAMFTPLAYDSAGDAAGNFTASDGAAGQPYILLGSPVSAGTQALSPSTDGEVPDGTTAGGGANPAAGGVSQVLAAGSVNTEDGDLAQSGTDVSVPGYGPALSFSRTYDSGTAQQQAQTAAPGPMGYGWTDSWASSLATARPVDGDIYTLAGMRTTGTANGPAPVSALVGDPGGEIWNGSNLYIADATGNRVLEVPNATGTQWGVSMTAHDTYTVAGSGAPAGGTLDHPQGIAFDSAGDLYIADTWHNRIVEIPVTTKTQWGVSMTAGHQYTIAGSASASSGTSGDGGPPTAALLSAPAGIAFDSAGDLYIADGANNRVQEIYLSGGNAWGVPSPVAGDVYTVAGNSGGTSGISGDGGASRSAYLSRPASVSVDSGGDVYIADSGNNRIQEMAAAAGTQWGVSGMAAHGIYTIAGSATGSAGSTGNNVSATSALLDGPQDVLWSGGNLYIADALNNRVREVAGTGHTEWGVSMTASRIYNVAGNGTAGYSGDSGAATSAEMNDPLQVALDSGGSMYIADASNNRLRKVSASAYTISTYAGDGYSAATTGDGAAATQAGLNGPMQEAFDSSGDTFIADAGNNRIQEIAASSHTQYGIAMTGGDVYTIAGSALGQSGYTGDGGAAASALLHNPWGIAIDASGNLYIADTGNNRIQEVPAASGTQWGQSMTVGDIYTIAGSATGSAGSSGDTGPASSALFSVPNALTIDAGGNIYISDSWNNRVREMVRSNQAQWGGSMTGGDIYTIAGSSGAGGSLGDGGPGPSAQLYGVGGLAVDSSGDLFIGDGGNNRVQELSASHQVQWGQTMNANDIYTVTGSVAPGTPDGSPAIATHIAGAQSLAIDSSGDLYIADEQDNRIQEIANVSGTQWGQSMTAGDEYTVAGSFNKTPGNSGDGGPAASALLSNTESISIDPEGDLYITDSANATVREVASAVANAIAPAPGQTSALVLAPQNTAPGGITITQPGGAQVTFWAQQTGGTCTAGYDVSGSYCILPQDQGATLTYNASTQVYTYSPGPGDDTYTYLMSGAAGQLTSDTDTVGNTLTIIYNSPAPGGTVTGNGTCPSAATSCETITSAHPAGEPGRALILGYNGGSDTGQVTSVTDPMSKTTTYGYDTGNPSQLLKADLTAITDPNAQPGGPDAGDSTSITYDTSGRVTRQTDPMNWESQFNYCYVPTEGNCMNPATGTGFVTVTDPDGNLTVYDYDQGTLAAQSEWTKTTSGHTFTSEDDSIPDATAPSTGNPSGGTLLDTASTDGDGNLTTTGYNTDGNPTSSTSPGPNGAPANTTTAYTSTLQQSDCDSTADAASTAACSLDSPPAPVAPGGTITPPSSAPPEGVTYTLYDTDGNELYSTTGVYEPGSSGAAYSQTTYQLFKNNSVTINGSNITCTNNTPPSPSLPCANINADGVVTQLAYDPEGDLAASSIPDGNSGGELATTTYVYDADGEQTSTTAPDGNLTGANAGNYTTVTAYNNDGQKTTVTQAGGSGATATPRPTTYGYDANGNQTSVEDARGYTTTSTFNADDQASLATDPDNDSALTCYDGDGETAQTVPGAGVAANSLTIASCPSSYPAGYSTRLASDATVDTFDALGHKVLETSPAPAGQSGNETTTYSYDGDGNLTETVAPPATNGGPNVVTVETYNRVGQLAAKTTGYGTSAAATTTYCYDPFGNPTAVVMPDGNLSGTAQCSASSPWTVTASPQVGYQTTYRYDSAGELVSTTTPATTAAPGGAITTTSYDPAGNVLSSTDPDGVITSYAYTPGNLKASVNYSEDSSATVAGTPGQMVLGIPISPSICLDDQYGETSPGNVIDIYGCNGSASQEWTANADGTIETLGNCLDVSGNGTSWGTPIVLEPCSASTPGEIWHAGAGGSWVNPNSGACLDDPGATTTWGTQVHIYGCNGTSAQDWASIQYGYDANSSKTTMTDATGSSSYAYDPFDELTSTDDGAGQTTAYAYNADGKITGITYPLPSAATWATADTVSYEYDHADELTSVTDFDGHEITIANTADGSPSSAGLGSTGDTITTSYDSTGTPSAITLKHSSTTLQSFTYSDSPAGTILSETDIPSSAQSPADYVYDAQGRVTSDTPGTGSANGYSFDASGSLTTMPTGAAGTYDHAGELTSSVLSGTTTTYTYRADGEQLTSLHGSTTESAATWNGARQLAAYDDSAANLTAAAYDGNGLRASVTFTPSGGSALTQGYVWDGDSLLMDSANAYIFTRSGAPAEQVNLSTGAIIYLVADSLGSVRGAVSSSGSLIGSTNYDAWGNPETTGGLTVTPFGYAGGYTDPDGLIYLINRYYDPSTGQFISIDPDVNQTLLPYAYTGGNPVTQTDPTGLLPVNMNEIARWADSNVSTVPYRFSKDDCTNFASEALLAGGYNVVEGLPSDATDDHYWFYNGNGSNGQLPDYSHSWSVAGDLLFHMVLTGSTYVNEWNKIQPGDIAFAVWDQKSWNGRASGINHAGVVGKVINGQVLIEQHSPTQHHVKLTYWLKYGGPDVGVWILKPKQD